MSLPCLRKLFRALLIWYDMQLQLTGLLFREGIRLEMILFVDCSTSVIFGLQHKTHYKACTQCLISLDIKCILHCTSYDHIYSFAGNIGNDE